MTASTDKTSKRWIKLTTRTSDAKVMRIAAITGVDRKAVYWSIINWFWYLDDNREETIVVTESGFHDIAVWTFETSLLAACAHETVNWLERAGDGLWRPTRPDSHFSQKAKDRAASGLRMRDIRSRSPDVAPNVAPRAQHLSLSDSVSDSGSGSESSEQAGEKPRAHRARAILTDDGHDSPLHRALAEWSAAAGVGWNSAAWGHVARWEAETLPVLGLPPDPPDAIQRIVGHLRRKGTAFTNVKYALACVGGAIEGWARSGVAPWEAVPQQATVKAETPEQRVDRMLAARQNGNKP